MLWKLLISCLAFFTRPFHGPPVDDIPYEATPYGPQSWREEHIAMKALHGENDDMLFHEDWPKSAGIKDTRYRWPGYPGKATIPYVIDASVKNFERLINQSIEQYHTKTCIKFVKRTNERNYINLVAPPMSGCSSFVGMQNSGGQAVTLGSGCGYVGTIVHELGHAIGLYHEHQRSDRNTYLNIYIQNVSTKPKDQRPNFDRIPASQELTFGHNYDYASIMHYGEYAFSKSVGRLKTMETKNGAKIDEPYNKPGLNSNDIDLIKKLYKC